MDAVRPIEARNLAAAFAPDARLTPDLALYFASFDLILSYLFDPGEIFQQNLARVSTARFLAGPHRPALESTQPAAEVFLAPLSRLGIVGADPVPRLNLRSATSPAANGRSAAPAAPGRAIRRLALHPGSGSERKNWPESRWSELLPRLAARGDWDLLLVGGEAEGDRLQRLAASWPPNRIEVARNLPLVQVAHRMETCQFFLGHDSGITHLAAALGLPGLVLWGESPLAVWRPRQEGMECLLAGSRLPELAVTEVWDALGNRLW